MQVGQLSLAEELGQHHGVVTGPPQGLMQQFGDGHADLDGPQGRQRGGRKLDVAEEADIADANRWANAGIGISLGVASLIALIETIRTGLRLGRPQPAARPSSAAARR